MSTTIPSRRLKNLALAVRIVFWLVVAAWLLLAALWAVLHGVIVPRIGEFRPYLEQRATLALGVPVRIGTVSARSDSLLPTVELSDVALIDAQGREALRLPRVLVALSPRTLLSYRFEQLYVEAPTLDVRRTRNGRLLVAGLDLATGQGNDTAAADWFFSQGEFVIRGGTIQWTDEQRGAAPLTLTGVDFVARNSLRRHRMRLDATPPAAWGARFSVQGQFAQPLLTTHEGHWRSWRGQVYADLPAIDVSQLRPYADLGLDLRSGTGALRAWFDIDRAVVTSGLADVALEQVDVRLGQKLEPLALRHVAGRVGGSLPANGFRLYTQGLEFQTADGLRWPGGNAAVSYTEATPDSPPQGSFQGDKLDLAALADIARRLPLGSAFHAALKSYGPAGVVERIQAEWRGEAEALSQYKASGRVTGLSVTAAPAAEGFGRPGLQGATVDFDLTQAGGKAHVAIDDGGLEFPGVFDEPRIPLDRLGADVAWRLQGERVDVDVNGLRFANADAEGQAQARWHTSEAADVPRAGRFPGVLDLQGSMSRADGTRVWRYLPRTLAAHVRDYVHQAVQQGRASGVSFKVRGNLHDMPFRDAAQGQFRIAAQVSDVNFDYVPPLVTTADGTRWPALTQLAGELVFDGAGMAVHKARGRLVGAPNLELSGVEARIPDMGRNAQLSVQAGAKGPLPELLALVRTSPLNGMTGQALAAARATGSAEHRLRLSIPLDNVAETKVQGSSVLSGNDLQMSPDVPVLSGLQGKIEFTETGFTVAPTRGRALGGELRFEGGMPSAKVRDGADAALVSFKGQGTVTAEGLRQARELGPVARLAQNLQGSAGYGISLAFRRGKPELALTSNLVGMASTLPTPLAKTADAALPLRYETALVPGATGPQDRLTLELGGVARAQYLRDLSGTEPRVLRGNLTVGAPLNPPASAGESRVMASVQVDRLDASAWEKALGEEAAAGLADAVAQPAARAASASGAVAVGGAAGYLPDALVLRANELSAGGYRLGSLAASGARDGGLWRLNLDATELAGSVEFRPAAGRGAGRLYARLSRLAVAPNAASDVEQILDRQPESIPALDIVVDDFELKGRKLGRVEIDAVNRVSLGTSRESSVREWRLNKLNISLPEASFSATGNWAAIAGRPAGPRETHMTFHLDVADSGKLLERFGMPGVIRRGKGRLEGQVAWTGSPSALDYPSLGGEFNVNVESGQFLKADPGLAKLLGVLSLQALPRRLVLDFRDVFSEGFAFDFVRGDVRIARGVASTNNLQMKGVNAAVLMDGAADIDKETQDLKVVVIPEINAGTASLVAAVINPAVGIGTFLAQMVLRQPVIAAATQEFQIDGTWADPRIVRVERKAQAPVPASSSSGVSP